jgi:putative protease
MSIAPEIPVHEMSVPELLAPAGDWDCLRAAVANGADAVFFGLSRFNARMRADNFRDEELPEVVSFLHNHGVKAFVTLNVLIFTDELTDAVAELQALHNAGVDAVIIQDVGLAEISRRMFPALRVHASTQMTITSPEGVRFAESLGIKQVVLARELSLRELEKFPHVLPLEMFVHGALCVAYSGQCLTSEALGRRSANRGECAQACRMPYELIVDGALHDLGDRRYLLSPQDLAAVNEIPELLARGVLSFKIEGRLKSPEYVAAVTSVYRKAIDAALSGRFEGVEANDWYQLEMTFSRGLYSGWMHGVNHQELVGARFGKKRGVFLGMVTAVGKNHIEISDSAVYLKAGDGVVFDTGGNTEHEQGGRIFGIEEKKLFFEHGKIRFSEIPSGCRVWKTSDPALDRSLRSSFSGHLEPRSDRLRPLDMKVSGGPGHELLIECDGHRVTSRIPLEVARNRPLDEASLRNQLGKLGGTPFALGALQVDLPEAVILPISEINRIRRELVSKLTAGSKSVAPAISLREILPAPVAEYADTSLLSVLVRSEEQLQAALLEDVAEILVDYEDIRRYKDAVATVRGNSKSAVFLATPRIQKAGEEGFFKLIANAQPDGVLIRNIGGISHFTSSPLRLIGDFSLNVANPAAAGVFKNRGLERLSISHDLNANQIQSLLRLAPPDWFELTLHHHMPMFHMEHCVFAAFLSSGTDHTNCGRPCEKHRVHLRDRVGMEHPLRADVGCRNTLFHSTAQTGASYFESFYEAGLRHFRIELLEETGPETRRIICAYRDLLAGHRSGTGLHRELHATSQVGVTRGTYTG